jgi:hypothetical protein
MANHEIYGECPVCGNIQDMKLYGEICTECGATIEIK